MAAITRDDARAFHEHWLAKGVPKNGGPRKSASMGNRMVGNMRVLYKAYFAHLGDLDRQTRPTVFRSPKSSRSRGHHFRCIGSKAKCCAPRALSAMNDQARAIVLTIIETGARPSEICNLTEPFIRLDASMSSGRGVWLAARTVAAHPVITLARAIPIGWAWCVSGWPAQARPRRYSRLPRVLLLLHCRGAQGPCYSRQIGGKLQTAYRAGYRDLGR